MKKCLAIIPARGGSKRIPRKNIKNFCGQPIIKYSIDTALNSNLFDEVMVSTEDKEIADIVKSMGAKVPFLRSTKNANDHATTANVINEVLYEYKKLDKYFDYFCCIYPTAPFINVKKLVAAFNLLKEDDLDEVVTVAKFECPIQWGMKVEDGELKMIWPQYFTARSQDLEPVYYDAGQFYWMKTKSFLKQKSLWLKKIVPLFLSNLEVQDIDDEKDWEVAEFKYNFINKKRLL